MYDFMTKQNYCENSKDGPIKLIRETFVSNPAQL